MRDRNH